MLKVFRPKTVWFKLEGPDARDFLHRLTTVDFRNQQVTEVVGKQGLFLTPQGKISAYFRVWNEPGNPNSFDFEIPVGSASDWPSAFEQVIDQFTFGENFTIARQTRPSLWVLQEDGKIGFNIPSQFKEVNDAEFDLWRIENMIPLVDHEVTAQANPLEIGLSEAIAEQKGCYPGQEVIERIISQGAPPRRLVRLVSPIPLTELKSKTGETIGTITSSMSKADGHYQALGLIKKSFASLDTLLEAGKIVQIA